MLALNKLAEMLASIRNEEKRLTAQLDKCLRRREDLHQLPYEKEEFILMIEAMVDRNKFRYPDKLKHKIAGLIQAPLHPIDPEMRFNPLMLFDDIVADHDALLFVFQKEIKAGVRRAIDSWEWPDKVGPPKAERLKELKKLDKEIADLQTQLEVIKKAARGEV